MVLSATAPVDTTAATMEAESTDGAANSTITQQTSGKQTTITDFVDSSFASVDRKYPKAVQGSSLVKILANEAAEERSKSKKEKKSNARNSESKNEDDDEDEAYTTFTYLAILTALYLPFLLFLWIRRNVFGTASLVRSLFFGHMLRFGVAFLLLPPSTTKTFVPTPVWNLGLKVAAHAEKFWNDKRTQAIIPDWAHVVLSMILGCQTDNQAIGGGALEKAKKSWPPPGVICFIVFTILSFVVHPDGITWIMLGQIQEFVHTSALEAAEYVQGLRNGSIKMKPSEISGTLASIIIIVTIVNGVLSNRKKNMSVSQREKAGKHKHKRGKKARGRNFHGGSSAGNKGRIRGGHYRSTKDIYDDQRETSPLPETRSLSPSRRMRTLSDEDSTVSTASGSIQPILDGPCVDRKDSSSGSTQESLTHTHVRQVETKLEENSVPPVQVGDDEKSCTSSVATAQTNATENGGRKKNRRNKGKRGGQKIAASAPLTPRCNKKTNPGTHSTTSPSTFQNMSDHSRVQNPGPDKKNLRKTRQNQKERTGHGRGLTSSTTASVRKTKQQPREQQNRRRSFTAPEINASQKNRLSEVCRVTFNAEQNESASLASLPISRTPQEPVKLEPLTPMFPSMNEARKQNFGHELSLGIQHQNGLSGELEKISMHNSARTYLNPNESLLINSPATNELSAFLVRLGLVGSIYAELMADLASVDSFALFTDADYIKYGIGPAQRAEIISHLENRNLRRAIENNQNSVGWNNTIVRPPPGLGAPSMASDPVVGGASRIVSPLVGTGSNNSLNMLPYFSSASTPVPSTYSLTLGSSLNSFSVPLGMPQFKSDELRGVSTNPVPLRMTERNGDELRGRVTNHITLPPISPLLQNIHPSGQSSGYVFAQQEHNDEEIEAGLQELGGQMAGSILDF